MMAVGLGMVLFALGNGIRSLGGYRMQLDEKRRELRGVEEAINPLDQEIVKLTRGPLAELITPKAIGIITGRKTVISFGPEKGQETDLINFTLWIDVPSCRRQDIREVRYGFPNPTYLSATRVGRDPSNGFAVSYQGWGVVPVVPVTVVQTNGDRLEIPFRFSREVTIR
jgi:hypothetical protein